MLTTPTLDKLRAMNLMGMARALQEQIGRPDYQALTFEERLGLMVGSLSPTRIGWKRTTTF